MTSKNMRNQTNVKYNSARHTFLCSVFIQSVVVTRKLSFLPLERVQQSKRAVKETALYRPAHRTTENKRNAHTKPNIKINSPYVVRCYDNKVTDIVAPVVDSFLVIQLVFKAQCRWLNKKTRGK